MNRTVTMKKLILLLGVVLMSFRVFAGEPAQEEFEAVPPPPEIPPQLESGTPIEPEVTIIRREDAVIEEYRVNGMLYMVKVTPAAGKPYYLIDQDGDGSMETKSSNIYQDPVVPQWILFSW